MFASLETEMHFCQVDAQQSYPAVVDLDMQRFLRRRLLLTSDEIGEIDFALAEEAGLIPMPRATAKRSQPRLSDISNEDVSERVVWLNF